tara:strand:- start:361 stop:558 length:198 start_codon:yes stop_codon:yes gene_type:complete
MLFICGIIGMCNANYLRFEKDSDFYKDSPVKIRRNLKDSDMYKDTPIVRNAKPTDMYKDIPLLLK